jgi:hypothetical protein
MLVVVIFPVVPTAAEALVTPDVAIINIIATVKIPAAAKKGLPFLLRLFVFLPSTNTMIRVPLKETVKSKIGERKSVVAGCKLQLLTFSDFIVNKIPI